MSIFRKLFKRKREELPDVDRGRYPKKLEIEKGKGNFIHIIGAKYPMRGIPREHFLKKILDPFKRKVNKTFLEGGSSFKLLLDKIMISNVWKLIYEEVPDDQLSEPVKEIARVLDLMIVEIWAKEKAKWTAYRKFGCSFIEEDFAYRYRAQWLLEHIDIEKLMSDPAKEVARVFDLLVEAERNQGMKKKWQSYKRTLCALFRENPDYYYYLQYFLKHLDMKKVKLSKGDRYYFRCKEFKVDD